MGLLSLVAFLAPRKRERGGVGGLAEPAGEAGTRSGPGPRACERPSCGPGSALGSWRRAALVRGAAQVEPEAWAASQAFTQGPAPLLGAAWAGGWVGGGSLGLEVALPGALPRHSDATFHVRLHSTIQCMLVFVVCCVCIQRFHFPALLTSDIMMDKFSKGDIRTP